MRIAMFSDNFYPELSGISDSIIRTSKELAKRGHQVTFYAPRHPKRNYEKMNLPPRDPDFGKNISVVRFRSLPYAAGTGQGRLVIPTGLRWLWVKKFNPDLIHSHLIFGVGLEGLVAAKILKKPFVGTNHTPVSEFIRYSPIKAAWFKTLALKYDVWYYNRCNFVSSPAQAIFDEMTPLGFRAPREAVSNPLDLETFRPLATPKNTLKKKLGLSGFTVLYAGRIAPEKRIDLVIRAVAEVGKKIPDITLAIVGSGPETANLKELARKLGVEGRVKFFGFVKTEMLPEIYNASDVFAIMSTAETQSLAAMQALSCGVPAVGVRAWGLKEYLGQAGMPLVEPGDSAGLSKELLALAKNPTRRKQLGERGRKFVQQFSADRVAVKWEKIYEKVLQDYNHRS